MCGIAGIWNVVNGEPGERIVERMLDAMRHRGPDGQGALTYRDGAAGMVRLALVDLSPRGQQPIWSPDQRVAILFNGEMYNFREERATLEKEGYPFHSTTDTEVVLALYLKYGTDFATRLRGMYAIAILDWRESKPGELPVLLLVRGPLGVKPLYIAQAPDQAGSLLFSSEIRAMLASGLVPRAVDRSGLTDYLTCGFVLQPRTIISGVRMMGAGTWERYAPGQPVETQRFYQLPEYEPRQETLDEAAERLRSVLDESIRLHALADAPVGAFLSGGVDSTGVVGLMRKYVSDLRTYTLRFPEFKNQDESAFAAEAARDFGCHNTIVDVTGRDVAGLLPTFAGDLDQPSTDGLNTWLVSRAAAREVKGVLSGIGGDEWFAGYSVTRRMAWYSTAWLGIAERLLGNVAQAVRPLSPSDWWKWKLNNLASRRSSLATWLHSKGVFRNDQARALVQEPSIENLERQLKRNLDENQPHWRRESVVGLACLLDATVYMRCQLLRDSDSTSMAHSLELRVPLVDLEIVKFARTCADEFKLNRDGGAYGTYQASGSKRVLVHALRDVLPPTLMTRVKRGFALPIEGWLKHELVPVLEDTTNRDAVAARGLLDPQVFRKYFDGRNQRIPGTLYPKKWSLMILELWCRAVLDQRPATPRKNEFVRMSVRNEPR